MDKETFFESPVTSLGRTAVRWVNELGAMVLFLLRTFLMIFHRKQFPIIIHQVYFIGARSATIVMLVGLFTGMVLGLQLFHTLVKFGSAGVLGTAVALSLIRELGPVLTAIMITARAGSSMAGNLLHIAKSRRAITILNNQLLFMGTRYWAIRYTSPVTTSIVRVSANCTVLNGKPAFALTLKSKDLGGN